MIIRKFNLFLVPILGISTLLLYCSLTTGHDWGDDFSAYIMQAKSIVERTPRAFIEINRFTIERSSFSIGPVCYPWGFPLMLAPLYAIFGINMIALKSVGVASFLIFLVILWFAFRKYHTDVWLVCFVCLFSFNPNLIAFSDNILSDFPFLLFSTICVVFIGRTKLEKRPSVSKVFDNIILGFLIAICFFIRTNGILLLVTLLLTQLISLYRWLGPSIAKSYHSRTEQARWAFPIGDLLSTGIQSKKALLICIIPYGIFFSFAIIWEKIFPEGGTSHISHLGTISLSTFKFNIKYYLELPADFLIGIPYHYFVYLISVPLLLIGSIRRLKLDYHIIIYLLLTLFLYILWPDRQGVRFLFPIFPFCCSFAITGLNVISFRIAKDKQKFQNAACLFPIIIVFLFSKNSVLSAYKNIIHHRECPDGPFNQDAKNLFQYVKHNTAQNSITIFFKPRAMRMMTGRQSIMINKIEELSRGDYLCLDVEFGKYDQVPSIDLMNYQNLQLEYENNEFKFYRLIKVPPAHQ